MANLSIEGATIGYDINELEAAIDRLNTNVIGDICRAMNSGMSKLRETVDSVWVGESAERFKSNMEHDKDTIQDALKTIREEVIEGFMDQVVERFDEIDQNLVKERSE